MKHCFHVRFLIYISIKGHQMCWVMSISEWLLRSKTWPVTRIWNWGTYWYEWRYYDNSCGKLICVKLVSRDNLYGKLMCETSIMCQLMWETAISWQLMWETNILWQLMWETDKRSLAYEVQAMRWQRVTTSNYEVGNVNNTNRKVCWRVLRCTYIYEIYCNCRTKVNFACYYINLCCYSCHVNNSSNNNNNVINSTW